MDVMSVKEIVRRSIAASHDGLCAEDFPCGCGIDDLMPCDAPEINCVAAYKNTHTKTGQIIFSTRQNLSDEEIERIADC